MTATINPRRSAFMVRSVGLGSATAFGQPVKRATATTATAAWELRDPVRAPAGSARRRGARGQPAKNEQKEVVVGLGGIEPPTSSLSGMRSNRLSYSPGLSPHRLPGASSWITVISTPPKSSANKL